MDKKGVSCGILHNAILLSCKKEGNFTFVTASVDLEGVMLSEISQSEKNKYHVISLICGHNEQNELISKLSRQTHDRQQDDTWWGCWGGILSKNKKKERKYSWAGSTM